MRAYEQLLSELESHQLQVVLAPSRRRDRRETDMIRVCADKNPPWYSRLCGQHLSSRGSRRGKPDTRLRRQNILRQLRLLAEGGVSRSKYAPELERVARKLSA